MFIVWFCFYLEKRCERRREILFGGTTPWVTCALVVVGLVAGRVDSNDNDDENGFSGFLILFKFFFLAYTPLLVPPLSPWPVVRRQARPVFLKNEFKMFKYANEARRWRSSYNNYYIAMAVQRPTAVAIHTIIHLTTVSAVQATVLNVHLFIFRTLAAGN